jgi:hypothetical protein
MKKTALSLAKASPILIAVCLVLSSFQVGFLSSYTVPCFSFKEINVNYQNTSPADNGSYTGDVPVNISVRYNARSSAKNAYLIPYQEISCLYRLDNGEWKNTSLSYASEQTYFGDPLNRDYWNDLYCNYSAVLHGLSNGVHLLDIDFKPDVRDHLRRSSNGTLFASEHSSPNTSLPTDASIVFFVFGNDIKPLTTAQIPARGYDPFLAIVAVAIIAMVVVVSGLLVYFRRRKEKP